MRPGVPALEKKYFPVSSLTRAYPYLSVFTQVLSVQFRVEPSHRRNLLAGKFCRLVSNGRFSRKWIMAKI
jgi:hypothetical protein